MEIRDLRCVLAIAESGSFLRAAERLHISQPSISTRIGELEMRLGVRLFKRESRGATPTQEGVALLKHARLILRQIDEVELELQHHAELPTGLVRIGLPTSLTQLLAVPLLERCLERFPGIKLRIIEGMSGHILDWLLTAKLELGLIFGTTPPSGIDIKSFATEDLRIAAAEDATLAALSNTKGIVPFERLEEMQLILPGLEHGLRALIEAQAHRHGTSLTVAIEIDAFSEIRRLVKKGYGFTILSSAALLQQDTVFSLASRRIGSPSISRTVSIARAAGRPPSRADRAVADELLTLMGESMNTLWDARIL